MAGPLITYPEYNNQSAFWMCSDITKIILAKYHNCCFQSVNKGELPKLRKCHHGDKERKVQTKSL